MADNEYAIWRAIGSLTQRVRDLEHPTPESEPPLCACGHSKREHEVFGVCQGSECGCMGYALPKPAPTIQPEVATSLPAAVEAAVNDFIQDIVNCDENDIAKGERILSEFKQRLAALWPKAGQVPSVEQAIQEVAEDCRRDYWDSGAAVTAITSMEKALLSRMGQPAQGDQPVGIGQIRESEDVRQAVVKVTHDPHYHAALDHDLNRLIDIVASEAHRLGDQPQLVTAEKLAEYLREEMSHWPSPVSTMAYSAWEGLAQGILKAFPTLGQGRLTRADPRVKKVITKAKTTWNGIDIYSQPQFDNLIDGLLALQGPMTVSREQWERLESKLESRHVILQPAIVFRQWLKAEFGIEVAE